MRALVPLLLLAGCRDAPPPAAAPVVEDATVAPDTLDVRGVRRARADLAPLAGREAGGTVRLTQTGAGVRVEIQLEGLAPHARYAVQVLHGRTCRASPDVHLGARDGVHGMPLRPPPDRHAGDLGTLAATAEGTARYDRIDGVLRLDRTASAVGRAVVLREGPDDGVTAPAGRAGRVAACGVIERDR